MTTRGQQPFTFTAINYALMSGPDLRELARRVEGSGYRTLVMPDHVLTQFGPLAAMTWIAAATDRLRVGAYVLNNDLRHPTVLAQELATIDVLSGGRLDIAIGAGFYRPEYEAIGLPYDPVSIRQSRLAEAVAVLKGAFGDGEFSFAGEHYRLRDHDGQPKPIQRPHPPILIGGGGRRTIELAAREAQVVGLAPRMRGSVVDPTTGGLEATREQIEWARLAAPERFAGLILGTYPIFPVTVTEDAGAALAGIVERVRERGIETTVEDLERSPHVFVGTIDSLVEKFRWLRDELGISSFMVGEPGPLDPLVERLAGQ